MIGIITSDFELLVKKNDVILDELSNEISNVKKVLFSLSNEFKSSDLKFIANKLNLSLFQFDNVLKKTVGYQDTLKSIYNGYQRQNFEITSDINHLMS